MLNAWAFTDARCQQSKLDEQLNAYWKGDSRQRQKAVKQILALKPSFDELYRKLAGGRVFPSNVRRGFTKVSQGSESFPPYALVFVPYDYQPEKKYPLRVFLHGASSNASPDFLFTTVVDTTSKQFKDTKHVVVYPSSWFLAPWWSEKQFGNIHRLLDQVKQTYNIDENQVRLLGNSDGGTGSFYLANCEITTWSCITPFIGSVAALQVLGERQTYMNNYSNKPFLIVNTGKDQIMRKETVAPFLNLFKEVNATSPVIWVDSSGHSTRWMPVLRDSINRYAEHHPRNPYPDKISWQTDNTKAYGRNHFLVLEQIAPMKSRSEVQDHNQVTINGRAWAAFRRDSLSGMAELVKEGNIVHVKTQNVRRYRLLVSPDHFDLSKPVIVFTNSEKSFEGVLKPDPAVLMKWNAIDNDRTMLFAAEILVKVN